MGQGPRTVLVSDLPDCRGEAAFLQSSTPPGAQVSREPSRAILGFAETERTARAWMVERTAVFMLDRNLVD